jgi:hypothetical protein
MNIDEFFNDYDWKSAFNESMPPRPGMNYKGEHGRTIDKSEIKEILYFDEGYNEGPNWIAAFKLTKKRYLMIRAGCDYTGWDCRASGDSELANSLKDLIKWSMNNDERERFGLKSEDK